MTAADLAELAAGLQGAAGSQIRRPTAQSLQVAGRLSQEASQHVATSNEPVVNTLWKVILLMLLQYCTGASGPCFPPAR